jgi:hypothetical protein
MTSSLDRMPTQIADQGLNNGRQETRTRAVVTIQDMELDVPSADQTSG